MEYLDFIVEEEQNKLAEQDYNEYKNLFKDVEKFIIKKNRIIYGGTALNEILPPSKKFYTDIQLPDYDVFTPTPKKDAVELAKYLHKKGYQYIEVKKGFWHEGTIKVYAEFQPVADFTFIRRKFYEFLLEQDKHNPKKNQKNKKLKVTFIPLLFWFFYKELSRPGGSLHRLKKVFTRFKTFHKEFELKPELQRMSLSQVPPELLPYLEKVRKYVKDVQVPVAGGFAIGLHLGANRRNKIECCNVPGIPLFNILSTDMDATLKDLRKIIPDMVVLKREPTYLCEIMPIRYVLRTSGENPVTFANISDISNGCYSVDTICGYKVGKLDTILNFLYANLINDLLYKTEINGVPAEKYTIKIINTLEKINNKKTLKERFNLVCYGREKTRSDVRKERWNEPKKIRVVLP